MMFRSTLDHRGDADSNRNAVELQRFAAWHWAQVPLKLGGCAALVLLHTVVRWCWVAARRSARAGGSGERRWSRTLAVERCSAGPGVGSRRWAAAL
jgi:hypothetical protein